MRKLWLWILCNVLGDHDWTCDAEQGLMPDPDRVKEDPIGYFNEYARGYCSRCGKLLPLH